MADYPKIRQALFGTVAVVVVAGFCFLFSGLVGYHGAALALLLTVSLLAISFDIIPVLYSAALSAFIWDFFFIPPRFTIHVDTAEDTILLIMYFVIALISGVLSTRIRRIEQVAREREEKANSVKLYNTILDSLSHELRTPLAAILGAADNLQSNPRLTEKSREQLIAEISKASLRLNQQVENLLNLSRLESGHIQPRYDWCDVEELIHHTVRLVEENNPGRRIGINVRPDLPLCSTDKGMLEQIIYNLLNNAAIHTPPTAAIDIEASCHANLLQIFIEDEGQGISVSDASKILNRTATRNGSEANGGGLGLSIVRGFTEALSGHVSVESNEPAGSRFFVTIPVKTTHSQLITHE